MSGWNPDCKCPECGRKPNIGFSVAEVERAKRERQAARITCVRCQRCGTSYWIRARDIARATAPTLLDLLDPKTAAALRRAGILEAPEIARRVADKSILEVKGLGRARLNEIKIALDLSGKAMVA